MNTWLTRPFLFAVLALTSVEAVHFPAAQAASGLTTLAESVLQTKLLEPLQKKEADRSRFSRAAQPPHARRIRILSDAPHTDRAGRSYLAFAVDERRAFGVIEDKDNAEASWFQNAITGCIYPESGEVLVRRGEIYYASSVLLGSSTPAAPADFCQTR